jgi:ketosteroid isomerase-like protein
MGATAAVHGFAGIGGSAAIDAMTAPDNTAAVGQIATARAAFVEAIRSRDAGAIAELYGDDARLVAPDLDPLRGRDDVAAFWQAGVASGITDVELEPEDVEVTATLAWEVGRYALWLARESGDPAVERGRYLLIYAPDAGGATGWHRAAEMFRPD